MDNDKINYVICFLGIMCVFIFRMLLLSYVFFFNIFINLVEIKRGKLLIDNLFICKRYIYIIENVYYDKRYLKEIKYIRLDIFILYILVLIVFIFFNFVFIFVRSNKWENIIFLLLCYIKY